MQQLLRPSRSVPVGLLLAGLLPGCSQEGWCERFNLACDLGGEVSLDDPIDEDGDIWEAGADCDDTDPLIHPSAEEVCDGIDNNCDGQIDEGTSGIQTWYIDQDFDGYGSDSSTVEACEGPTGFVLQDGDCAPSNPAVNPGATERCGDGVDNDCNDDADICYHSGKLRPDDAEIAVLASASEAVGLGGRLTVGPDPSGTSSRSLALAMGAPTWDGDSGGVWMTGAGEFFFTTTGTFSIGSVSRELTGMPRGWLVGSALALPGDVDGDGYKDLAVGMPGARWGETGEGAVLVTHGPTATGSGRDTSEDRFLLGAEADARMGTAVAGVPSPLGGTPHGILAGAPGASDGRGAVVLMFEEAEGFLEPGDAFLRIRGGDDDVGLGEQVAGGDIDGDGVGDLIVASVESSRVYVFLAPHEPGEGDVEHATATLTGDAADALGTAMAVVSDLDGDGNDELLLGGPGRDDSAGAAWLVGGGREIGGSAAIDDVAWASWSSDQPGAMLGAAVAGAGRFTSSSRRGIVLGAPGTDRDDGVSEAVGAAWIITELDGGATELSGVDDAFGLFTGESANSRAGSAVAVVSDLDSNNVDEIVIGIPGAGSGQVVMLKAPGR
ncbi:MAG: FG-GAP repeat protein [Alphaproteobacteria bacterium]|nr:FG-GAP repeat protein [Alphaproteobacteria bacterium]